MKCKILTMMVLVLSTSCFAQTHQTEFIRNQLFQPRAHFKTWGFSDANGLERFTEMAFPVSYLMQLNSRLAFQATTAPFMSSMNYQSGEKLDFSNVTDTYVQASYVLLNNLALLTVGGVFPSGETNLDKQELRLAGIAANRPLSNPVTHFGSGTNVNVGLALARNWGQWVFGAGFGYSWKGKYDAMLDTTSTSVKPGNEMNLTVGVERSFQVKRGEVKFTADFIFTKYGEDFLNDLAVYEAGDKILVNARLSFPVAIWKPVVLSATNRWRMDNRSTNTALLDNGNEAEFRATFFQPTSDRVSLRYLVDVTIYGNTVKKSQGASILGLGAGFNWRLSRRVLLDPTLIYYRGHINAGPKQEIGITGWEASGGFSFRF